MIAPFVVTKTKVGLWTHTAQRCATLDALTHICLVDGLTFIIWTQTSICSMSIKVHNIAWNSRIVVIERASSTKGIKVAYKLIKRRRLQAIQEDLPAIEQRS